MLTVPFSMKRGGRIEVRPLKGSRKINRGHISTVGMKSLVARGSLSKRPLIAFCDRFGAPSISANMRFGRSIVFLDSTVPRPSVQRVRIASLQFSII
jgi:hypothetical protein